MSQEILTGNVLTDGIFYHASDINAAINGATLLADIIEDKPAVVANQAQKILVSDSASLAYTSILSVMALTRTNMQTAGVLNAHEGIAFSGQLTIAIAGTLNDWAPTNFSKSTIITTTGTATITGMSAPAAIGTLKVLSPNSGTMTLKREDAGSAAVNRMFWGTNPTLTFTGSECAVFLYFNNRWVLVGSSKGF
jgi:hypothetical protein